MNAKTRFLIAIVVLGLLMTGPFVFTAVVFWLDLDGFRARLRRRH